MAILAALVFIGLTGWLSTLSFALRRFSRSRLEELLPEAVRADRLRWFDRHTSDTQIVVALLRAAVNMGLFIAVYLAWNAAPVASAGRMVVPVALSLALLMVFSIALPHVLAEFIGERMLAGAQRVLALLRVAGAPLVALLNIIESVVRRLLGRSVESKEELTERVEQEILDVVSQGEAAGAVDEQQKELITSVIELGDTNVSAIMTPRAAIDAVPVDATLEQVRNLVLSTGHSRIPVYEESIDRIIGVVYAKDLLRVRTAEAFALRRWMRRAPYVPETKSVNDLLDEFRATRVQIAIALDEYGQTAGIATIEDILEEIVGEIDDEYDVQSGVEIRRVSEDAVEVGGRVSVWDVNEQLQIELPVEGGYETIGGFVSSALGKIPAAGEEFSHENVHFRVVDAEPRKVNRLRIQVQRSPAAV